jgi:hypothetical protein
MQRSGETTTSPTGGVACYRFHASSSAAGRAWERSMLASEIEKDADLDEGFDSGPGTDRPTGERPMTKLMAKAERSPPRELPRQMGAKERQRWMSDLFSAHRVEKASVDLEELRESFRQADLDPNELSRDLIAARECPPRE